MSFFNRTLIQRERQFEPFEAGEPGSIDELLGRSESIRLLASPRAGAFPVAKRVFDVVLSSAALVILAPALLIAGAVVKIDSPGPIFFVQERIGLNRRRGERRSRVAGVEGESRLGFDRRKNMHPGRPFKIYKFRTMVQDAERFGPALASEHDPRVTRVGRFMRKARIDELPQFLNVLLGDMSIIGPRPERSFFINRVRHEVPQFTMRLLVKPGITGLAQVENGYTSSIDEMRNKLFYDLKYIAEFSLWQEIRILFKTVYVVVTGKGAC